MLYYYDFEAYEFSSTSATFRLTPNETNVIDLDENIYESCPIERSEMVVGSEPEKMMLTFKMSCDHALVRHLLQAATVGEVTAVRVYGGNYHEFFDLKTHWLGRVTGIEISNESAIIRCESAFASLKRPGLRRVYSRTCQHVLYSDACGATPITASTEVTAATGSTVTVNAVPANVDGKLSGGWLETENFARYMIVDQSGNDIRLLYPVRIAPGTTVTLVAGCDHSVQTCKNRFNNLANYGGFPFIPKRNPFSTGVF